MTLEEAIAAVEATLKSTYLRVDRRRPLEDEVSYLPVSYTHLTLPTTPYV